MPRVIAENATPSNVSRLRGLGSPIVSSPINRLTTQLVTDAARQEPNLLNLKFRLLCQCYR